MRTTICGVLAAITCAVSAAPAIANGDHGSWQQKDRYLRATVIRVEHKRGLTMKAARRAPGCDLVALKCANHPHPGWRRVHAYFEQLRSLIHPRVSMIVTAGPPRLAPAGTASPHLVATGVAACIIQRESRGNPYAVNGQYEGEAQWSPEAWARMGGHRYAPTPLGATQQEQNEVLAYGLEHYGTRDWGPYDGCG
jgi:hypothetical protein